MRSNLLVIFILFYLGSESQTLSKKDMIDDFNYLIKSIKESFSQYQIKENITGFNFDNYFEKQRALINNKDLSESEFVHIVNSTLTYCQDQHTNIIWYDYLDGYDTNIVNLFKKYDKATVNRRIEQINEFVYSKIKYDYYQAIKCNYLDGKYYTNLPIKYHGKKYDYGLQIIKMNGKPIDSIVNNNLDNIYCNWDFNNKKYFSENFASSESEFINKDSVFYTLVSDKKDTLIFTYKLGDKDLIKYKNKVWIESIINKVIYFKKEKILYIRLFAMSFFGSDKIINDIRKCKDKRINKVVIDIRGDRGGSDMVWISVINNIINKPLSFNINIASKNIEKTKLFYSDVLAKNYEIVKPPFLNDNFVKLDWSSDIEKYFKPDKNSINYSGKIYVLQDKNIFSGAVSLSTLCLYSDKLVSYGESNGKIGGFSEEPAIFVLPNSQIMYRIEMSLDYSQVKTVNDYYNKVEIPIKYNLTDFYNRASKNWTPYSKHFLRKKDSFFKKIINF